MGLSDIETIPETGAVFTIGRSRFADNIASHFFIRKDPVVSITCGDEHSAVICQSGRLFVFGSNDWGQLGLGHKNHVSKPSCVKVLKPEKVTHVACGRAHTLICTGDQKIFACGSDQEGQLGRGSSGVGDSASSPVLVYDCGLAGPKILQVQAGSHHSLALTSDGGVIAWGSNLEGQLGLSGISGLVNQPTKVQIPEPVKQISAGYYHSAFLTESGLIYVCGESESGKLGIEVSFSTQVAPKQMQLPCPAVHVACGGHHTLILADTGNLYCVGSNASGQLGMGTTVTELQTPKLLPRGALQDETITEIACGESHSAVLTDSGKLFTCGDGRHGKLGLEENENNVHELTIALKYLELFVTNVACGGCHTILVAQRRGTGISRETESMQTDLVQKRTALPPLKVPVNRLPTENHGDKIKEKEVPEVGQENNLEQSTATVVTMTAVTMITTNPETTNAQENVVEKFEKIKVDSENDIEKLGSPKESSDDVPKEILSKSNEAEETIKEDTTVKQKNDNENNEIKVDKENNVEEEIKTESTTEEKNDTKSNVENSSDNNNESNKEESTEEDCTKSIKGNNNGDASDAIIEDKQTNNNSEAKMSPEKHVSSSSGTPPPKPPRLKSESSNSLSTERISSGDKEKEKIGNQENDDITSNEENSSEKSQANLKHGLASKHESASTKSSAKGGSSTSRNSKADTEEITEIRKAIDEVDEKGKPHEQEKMDNENTVDDADVVQSPAPRIGKMSKIFKSKKQQEIENGTKAASTVSHKAKSKTCTIL